MHLHCDRDVAHTYGAPRAGASRVSGTHVRVLKRQRSAAARRRAHRARPRCCAHTRGSGASAGRCLSFPQVPPPPHVRIPLGAVGGPLFSLGGRGDRWRGGVRDPGDLAATLTPSAPSQPAAPVLSVQMEQTLARAVDECRFSPYLFAASVFRRLEFFFFSLFLAPRS